MQRGNVQKALVAKEGLKHFEIVASKEGDELTKKDILNFIKNNDTLRKLDFNND